MRPIARVILLAFLVIQLAQSVPASAQDTLRAGIDGSVQAGLEKSLQSDDQPQENQTQAKPAAGLPAGQAGLEGNPETLIVAYQDRRLSVRERAKAIRAMGGVSRQSALVLPWLRKALVDPKTIIRHNAVKALGQMGPLASGAIPDIEVTATDDDSQWVRRAAQRVFHRIRFGLPESAGEIRMMGRWKSGPAIRQRIDALLKDRLLGEIHWPSRPIIQSVLWMMLTNLHSEYYVSQIGQFPTRISYARLAGPDRIVVVIQDQTALFQNSEGTAPQSFSYIKPSAIPEEQRGANRSSHWNGRKGPQTLQRLIDAGVVFLEESFDSKLGNYYHLTFPLHLNFTSRTEGSYPREEAARKLEQLSSRNEADWVSLGNDEESRFIQISDPRMGESTIKSYLRPIQDASSLHQVTLQKIMIGQAPVPWLVAIPAAGLEGEMTREEAEQMVRYLIGKWGLTKFERPYLAVLTPQAATTPEMKRLIGKMMALGDINARILIVPEEREEILDLIVNKLLNQRQSGDLVQGFGPADDPALDYFEALAKADVAGFTVLKRIAPENPAFRNLLREIIALFPKTKAVTIEEDDLTAFEQALAVLA